MVSSRRMDLVIHNPEPVEEAWGVQVALGHPAML